MNVTAARTMIVVVCLVLEPTTRSGGLLLSTGHQGAAGGQSGVHSLAASAPGQSHHTRGGGGPGAGTTWGGQDWMSGGKRAGNEESKMLRGGFDSVRSMVSSTQGGFDSRLFPSPFRRKLHVVGGAPVGGAWNMRSAASASRRGSRERVAPTPLAGRAGDPRVTSPPPISPPSRFGGWIGWAQRTTPRGALEEQRPCGEAAVNSMCRAGERWAVRGTGSIPVPSPPPPRYPTPPLRTSTHKPPPLRGRGRAAGGALALEGQEVAGDEDLALRGWHQQGRRGHGAVWGEEETIRAVFLENDWLWRRSSINPPKILRKKSSL